MTAPKKLGTIAERIKAKSDGASEIISIPEWDEKIEVRSMTGLERSQFLKAFMRDGEIDQEALYPSLLIAACFDPETGEKIFAPDAATWINSKNSAALERVAKAAMRLSGIDEGVKDKVGEGS